MYMYVCCFAILCQKVKKQLPNFTERSETMVVIAFKDVCIKVIPLPSRNVYHHTFTLLTLRKKIDLHTPTGNVLAIFIFKITNFATA